MECVLYKKSTIIIIIIKYAICKDGGTLAWSMLKLTICEIIGENVSTQSFNKIVGTGSKLT